MCLHRNSQKVHQVCSGVRDATSYYPQLSQLISTSYCSSKSRISRLESENRRLQKRLANVTDASSSRAIPVPSLSSSSSGQDQNSSGSNPISNVTSASDSRSRSDDRDIAPHSRQHSGEYRYRDTRKASFDETQSANIGMDDIGERRQKQLMVEAESQRKYYAATKESQCINDLDI